MTSKLSLFSNVVVIKQIYFFTEFPGGIHHIDKICDDLVQSGKFRKFTYPDKNVFTEHFREPGEVSRTLEMKEAVEVLNLDLVETKLSGRLRLLVTIYRAGFVVLSFVHSVIPKGGKGQPTGKNLTSENHPSSIDIIYLLEEHIPSHAGSLKYEVKLENQKREMETHDLVEYLLDSLEAKGMVVRRTPTSNTNTIHCWNPNFPTNFSELLEKNYKDFFLVFTTPQLSQPLKPRKEMLKKLKDCCFWSSENRGVLFRSNAMLIVSPIRRKPIKLLFTQLPWIFQLASTQNFMLKFYSKELRRLTSKISSGISSESAELVSEVFRLTSAFSLGLEDLYWVESDMFRMQAARFIAEYKKRLRLEEMLATLEKRFAQIKERRSEVIATLQHRAEREREKSIRYLTLIFATFGLGEILSNFIVWYFGYLQSGVPPIPALFLAIGLSIPFLAICILYFVSRWYITKKY